jgi:hypothetical protein
LSCAYIHPCILRSNIWDSQNSLQKKQSQQQNTTHLCEHITWLHVFIAYRIIQFCTFSCNLTKRIFIIKDTKSVSYCRNNIQLNVTLEMSY